MEELDFRAQTLHRAPARDGLPQQGPRDRLPRRAARRTGRAGLQVRRRHRRLRRAPQRVEGAAVRDGHRRSATPTTRARSRSRCSGTPATTKASTRSRTTSPPPRAACTRRASRSRSPTCVNRYAAAEGPPQGEGREPPRRGHPRGPHRDHLGEAAQPAVRGSDQDEARQHRDPLVRRARHQREARRVARGAPERGPRDRAEGAAGARGAAWRPARRATSRGASRCSSRRRCRASSPTARRATPRKPSCSSSRATAPAAAPRRRATRRSRRSCRSAARS